MNYTIHQSSLEIPFSFFSSWSGGKDSSLALHHTLKRGARPGYLLTMMIEDGTRSRSHGIPRHILEKQANCLGIPIRFCSASWQSYTSQFSGELSWMKSQGIDVGIFGDIDLEAHLEWVKTVCSKQQIVPLLPLWKRERRDMLNELFDGGFRAEIVAVKEGVLSPDFLGKTLDHSLLREFETLGIDLCGEAGEYHTIVTDGSPFSQPLSVVHGEKVLKDGYWFSDLSE